MFSINKENLNKSMLVIMNKMTQNTLTQDDVDLLKEYVDLELPNAFMIYGMYLYKQGQRQEGLDYMHKCYMSGDARLVYTLSGSYLILGDEFQKESDACLAKAAELGYEPAIAAIKAEKEFLK